MGCTHGQRFLSVYIKEEWLIENETMGPGSAHRGYGNHWYKTDGVMFMWKWFKRSETLFCSLYGIVLFLRAESVNKVS